MQCEARLIGSENTPQFKPILLEYRKLFETYTKHHGYLQSEASFANHFIWQHFWDIRFAADTKAMLIAMDSDMYRPLLLPPFLKDLNDSILPHMLACEEYMFDTYGSFFIKGATDEMVAKIKADCGDRYQFEYDANNSEYVYHVEDLIQLKGKKYHSKRNHINTFLKKYNSSLDEYTPKFRDECLQLQDKWAKESEADERVAFEEKQSIVRALDHMEELGLQGCVARIDGQVAAFSVGERINEEACLIHIEKADKDFRGLYAYINREFAANFWSDCKYINREEDMGVPGIRKAKESYYPAFMVNKYNVLLNQK